MIDRATSELDSGNSAVAIFIDLSKAFDTLNHVILIKKLHYYGINNMELSRFSSYLSNRSQYVEIDHVKSNYSFSSIGIPQGSILGPLFTYKIQPNISSLLCMQTTPVYIAKMFQQMTQ